MLAELKLFKKKKNCDLFLIKWQAFWPEVLLKENPTQVFSCEYSEIFKSNCFVVETLENGTYLRFLISEIMHSLLGKVKKVY